MQPRLSGLLPFAVKSSSADWTTQLKDLAHKGSDMFTHGMHGAGDQLSGFIDRVRAGDPDAVNMLTTVVGGGAGGIAGMLAGGEGNRILGGLTGAGIGAGLGAGAGYLDNKGTFGTPGAIGRGVNQFASHFDRPLIPPANPAASQAHVVSTGDPRNPNSRYIGGFAGAGVGHALTRNLRPFDSSRFDRAWGTATGMGPGGGGHLGRIAELENKAMRSHSRGNMALSLAAILAGVGVGSEAGSAAYNHFKQGSARDAVLCALGIYKRAFDASNIDSLLPDNPGVGGALNDFLLMPGAQRRAGRASALAESLGEDAPMSVDYPTTSRMLHALVGAAAGAGLGAGASAITNGLAGDSDKHPGGDTWSPTNGERRMMIGTGAGGAIGSLLGALVDTASRRKSIKKIKGDSALDLAAGAAPSTALHKGNPIAGLISGVHQQGRADTAESIAFNKKKFRGNPVMTALQIAGNVPYAGVLAAPPHMVGSVANYLDARDRMAGSKPQPIRSLA